ncbi:MAG: TonB-dependent receptor [Saprospiraceae bacterium]|nr:TonB-dependent receptor [Saprospiraceae bacterium]
MNTWASKQPTPRRVNRPGFQQQNPFSYFIDSLTYTRGNPNLRPEIANNYQLNVTYDNQPFIGFSYSETDDVIVENAPKIEGTKTFTVAENLANQKRLKCSLISP